MASFGVYLAACGYEHHGPKRHIGFAPRISPERFRAAFTAAEGWGTFSQEIQGGTQRAGIAVKWGLLRLRTVSLGVAAGGSSPKKVAVTLDGRPVAAQLAVGEGRAVIQLEDEATVTKGARLEIELS